MPFEEWLKNNIARSAAAPLYDTRWESRFAVFYWLLWKDHCSAVLNSDYSPKDDILFRDNRLVDECIQGNVDASVRATTGQAAISGLLRDECGDWLVGFTRLVGRCSVSIAELWALHDMLICAWSRGFRKVIIKTDCLEDLVIRHVPWDGNALEDRLSKWGRLHSQEAMTLAQPPSSLCALVSMDKESGLRDSLLPQDWLSNANAACFNLRTDPGR
ncbi:hypothetical protein V6N11_013843 [Hibiscus sabdariffa]|uniref:RNase H type-1 domain-containing protein n=2 Tax=Hibiscus sabdariffa TaxID=183260 RepID=A0ABR2NAB9_9ROSI